VCGDDDRKVAIWDTDTGRELTTFVGHTHMVVHVSWSRDGRRLVTAALARNPDRRREVKVWDADTGRVVAEFTPRPLPAAAGNHPVGVAGLSPDGGTVAFDEYAPGSEPGREATGIATQITVCDVTTGVRRALTGPGPTLRALVFCADGRRLAALDLHGRLFQFDAPSGQLIVTSSFTDADKVPGAVAYSPDGRLVAAADREQVKVWHVESGQEVLILRGAPPRTWDPGFTTRLAWSPDGRRLAATNWDASVSVWDAADREAPTAKADLRAAAEGRAFDWHLRNLVASLEAEERFAADFHRRAVAAAEPPGPALRRARGDLYARLGDWQAAADDYAVLASQGPPDDVSTMRRHALLRLQINDREGYRRACDRLWERCRRPGPAPPGAELLRVLALVPLPAGEAAALRDWAVTARRGREGDRAAACILGLAEFRAGRFADAVRACEGAATGSDPAALLCRAVLALASQQAGHAHAARTWLDQADQALRDAARDVRPPGTVPPNWDWTDWVEIQVLLREAASAAPPKN
jgi:hypothetical protein